MIWVAYTLGLAALAGCVGCAILLHGVRRRFAALGREVTLLGHRVRQLQATLDVIGFPGQR